MAVGRWEDEHGEFAVKRWEYGEVVLGRWDYEQGEAEYAQRAGAVKTREYQPANQTGIGGANFTQAWRMHEASFIRM